MASIQRHDIVVIGASAGGVEALLSLTGSLPSDLPASLFVVLHTPARERSMLPAILSRSGPLPATHAEHSATIERGRVYVAPPDHHLLVKRGSIAVTQGPRENRQRPAVDPLFRSAALAYGSRVMGVVLSGSLDDGASGLVSIKSQGSVALVQDPHETLFDSMPRSAIETVAVDHVLPVGRIAAEIARLSVTPVTRQDRVVNRELELETRIAEVDPALMREELQLGAPASLGCPECVGTLWEMHEGSLTRFRCRVGHAYTASTLLDEQASLHRRLMARAEENGHPLSLERYRDRVGDATRRAEVVRRFLLSEFDDAAAEPPSASVAESIGGRSRSS